MKDNRPIFLVEDNNADSMITRQALKELAVTNMLVHTVDGEDALSYLRKQDNQKPCVILLDLNMPRMNGLEFLKVAKSDANFKVTSVVVMTTSDSDQNIADSFSLGAAGYIVKPIDYKQFVEAMKTLNTYWTLSELPNEN